MEAKRRLRISEIAAYGIGGFFVNLVAIGDQFGMYFLTDVVLLPSGIVGTIMLLTTFFDAVNDPIIGSMADRCETRFGKYRPFMVVGGIIMAVMMILRFTDPGLSGMAKAVYYCVVLMGFSVGFSACCIPWQSLMSVASKDYTDRNILLTVRSISGAIVAAMVGVIVLPGVEAFGGGAGGWSRFVTLICCIGFIALLICQFGMRRVDYRGSIPTPEKRPLLKKMVQMFRYKPVICIALAAAFTAFTQTLGGVCSMHYYRYVLGDVNILQRISAFSLPIGIICPFLLPFILQKIDKKYMLIGGFLISMIKPMMIAVLGQDITVNTAVVLILISRIGTSFFGSAIFAWIPECVDFTTWKEGASSAAFISASVTFMQKVGRAVAQWTAGACLDLAGYQADAVTQRAVEEIIRINGIYLMAGLCIALLPIILFPITRQKGDEIRAQLLAREAQQNAKDNTL